MPRTEFVATEEQTYRDDENGVTLTVEIQNDARAFRWKVRAHKGVKVYESRVSAGYSDVLTLTIAGLTYGVVSEYYSPDLPGLTPFLIRRARHIQQVRAG